MTPRVAVVGAGYWGKNLVRNFHRLGALATVCDVDEPTARELLEQYEGVSYEPDFARLLDDPAIDGIVLATPAVTHFEMARRALLAGKDVLVEKPLAIEIGEGEEMVALARREGRVLMVGHILRYHPAVVALAALIEAGEVGQLRYVYSNRLNIGKIRTEENILWSFAPHDISVMLALLGEEPAEITCQGGSYLHHEVSDVTLSQFRFPSGVRAHIFVSWLHPFKEQRLVVVGSEKMAVFDDTADDKLVLYPHRIEWRNRIPTAVKAEGQVVALEAAEPLALECRHFLDCVESRSTPLTDGEEGLRVLRVLDGCQAALRPDARIRPVGGGEAQPAAGDYFAHESAYVDEGAEVGAGSKVWHFGHVMKGARIGERCVLGQNVNIAGGVEIGDNVKIQNNVSLYTGVKVEDDVFFGPSCVLTNVSNPRSQVNRHALYETTLFRRGCTIGANATIVCGVTVGRYAFVGAGAVVTRDVPDYGLVLGNPGRLSGWMSRHGHRLPQPDADGEMVCPEAGYRYKEISAGVVRCLDLGEDEPLPEALREGTRSFAEFKAGVRESLPD